MEVEIIENHIETAIQASEEAVNKALEAIGILCQEHAADKAPVDTGALKQSMTHELGDKLVKVGSRIEYAPYVEYIDRYYHKTGQAHFLRDAVMNHTDEYKRLAEQYLTNA